MCVFYLFDCAEFGERRTHSHIHGRTVTHRLEQVIVVVVVDDAAAAAVSAGCYCRTGKCMSLVSVRVCVSFCQALAAQLGEDEGDGGDDGWGGNGECSAGALSSTTTTAAGQCRRQRLRRPAQSLLRARDVCYNTHIHAYWVDVPSVRVYGVCARARGDVRVRLLFRASRTAMLMHA